MHLREREHWASFRHAVAAEHVDAARTRGLRQTHGQRRSADYRLPARKIDIGRFRRRQNHLQDRRHAMRERHLLAHDQIDQRIRQVAARINLLHAELQRDVRHAPGMHVEHRRDRHVDVAVMEALARCRAAQRSHRRDRMQHELAMTEVHALGQAGRAGRVERRRARVLVEIGEGEIGRRVGEQAFVFAGALRLRGQRLVVVADPNEMLDGFELRRDLFEQRQKVAVDQEHFRPGMIDRVENLL